MTFEEARAVAERLCNGLDNYIEFENAYVFGSLAGGADRIGPGPIVIMKSGGDPLVFTYALDNDMLGDLVERGSIKARAT